MFGRKEIEKRLEHLENEIKRLNIENQSLHHKINKILISHSKYKLGDVVEILLYDNADNLTGIISKIFVNNLCVCYRITLNTGNDFEIFEENIKKVIKNVCKK